MHLKETTASDQGQYMSLSHCWGKEQIITTTTSTLSDRKAGIKLPELSKTFRHAVTITRGLGIRYLWIDSLCIIQDSRQDWEIESAQMASIYTNSLLNLAATHSSNGKGGCFAERWSLDSLSQVELNVGDDIVIEHVAHDQFTRMMDYENTMEHTSPLLSRGWVFQERLLARRTLHFHAEELIWECASGLSCECSRLEGHRWGDPDGLLQVVAGSRESKLEQLKMMYTSILSPTATEAKILDVWLELVTEYCSLKLTKQMDRLPALSGLATRVASRLSSEYLAGVWSQDLPRALCWRKELEYKNEYPSFRDPNVGIVSWSWASVGTHSDDVPKITYDLVNIHGFVADPRCQVQGFHRTQNFLNPFGGCENAWIKIRGPLIQGTFRQANGFP